MTGMIMLPLPSGLLLFFMGVILIGAMSLCLLDFFDDLTYCLIDLAICQYFFGRVDEEDICT